MSDLSFPARFDGERVLFDAPVRLPPNTKLIVTVISEQDDDGATWRLASNQSLARAYGDDEPEYSLNRIKEANPEYEGR